MGQYSGSIATDQWLACACQLASQSFRGLLFRVVIGGIFPSEPNHSVSMGGRSGPKK